MKNISDSAPLMPAGILQEELPDVVLALLFGADVIPKYRDGDGFQVELGMNSWHLSKRHYDIALSISKEIESEIDIGRIPGIDESLRIRRHAAKKVKKFVQGSDRKSVAMLKDKGSSGWWRMILPMEYMDDSEWDFDCSAAPCGFDALLEYDVIFVQRVHDWDSFYSLEKLKKAGKRIVYDIDDDLFNITPDNPAYNTITRDDQVAAAHCMCLADVVTTTTKELKRRLVNVVDGIDPVIIPNAWDVDDRWPVDFGSVDGKKRILWSGGASHGADWEECYQAVSEIMDENDDIILVILGYLPPCIESSVRLPHFQGRIEFCGFRHPHTYYEMLHHVRADVGLCPLRKTGFNQAKSAIKYLEYSCIGIPTVASDWLPYSGVIEDGCNGRLVDSKEEWKESICQYLRRDDLRQSAVVSARETCQQYDIKKVVNDWHGVLCSD